MKLLIHTRIWLHERLQIMSGRDGDRGESALGWVLIAAFTVALIAAVYAAINGKVAEKIGLINDA